MNYFQWIEIVTGVGNGTEKSKFLSQLNYLTQGLIYSTIKSETIQRFEQNCRILLNAFEEKYMEVSKREIM